jgi:DNA-binding XRE family transcriptional regulator
MEAKRDQMPFKKINASEVISQKRADQEFDASYAAIAQEYELIRQVVETRKKKGITQKRLAEMVGVSQQVISRLEREKHMPKLSNFIRILEALDLKVRLVDQNPAYVHEGEETAYEKHKAR